MFRNPLLSVAVTIELLSIICVSCVSFRAVVLRPVWIGTVAMIKDLLCLFYEIHTRDCDAEFTKCLWEFADVGVDACELLSHDHVRG